MSFSKDDSGGGATRPLPRDGGTDKFREDQPTGTQPKVWTRDQIPQRLTN